MGYASARDDARQRGGNRRSRTVSGPSYSGSSVDPCRMASRLDKVLLVLSSPSSNDRLHRTLREVPMNFDDCWRTEDLAEGAPLRRELPRRVAARADDTTTHGRRAVMDVIWLGDTGERRDGGEVNGAIMVWLFAIGTKMSQRSQKAATKK